MSLQAFFPTPYRRLDRPAWLVIVGTLCVFAACLGLRLQAHQWSIDQRIYWISTDPQQRIWISLPDELVVTNLDGVVHKRYPWQDLGAQRPMVNLVFAEQSVWMRQIDGSVMRCNLGLSHCQPIERVWSEDGYASLAQLPNQQVMLLDNQQGQILVYDAQGSKPQHVYAQNRTNLLNALTSPLGLYRANGSAWDMARQQWVVANTGHYRLDAWSVVDGVINFQQKPTALFDTEGQPYFIEKIGEYWLSLEGAMSLSQGWLNQYRPNGQAREIPLGISDPTSMLRIDNSVLVSDMATAQIVRVDIDPKTGDFLKAPWVSPELQRRFQQIDQHKQWLAWLAHGSLALMVLLLIGSVLWLKKQGYDLNQAI